MGLISKIKGWIAENKPVRAKTLNEVERVYKIRVDGLETLLREKVRSVDVLREKLDEKNLTIQEIIDKATKISFKRDWEMKDRYAILIDFNPRMFGGGYWDRKSLQMLGEYLGFKVCGEVVSARFIQSADDLEHERLDKLRPKYKMYNHLDQINPNSNLLGLE
jgi:hypothetical protein